MRNNDKLSHCRLHLSSLYVENLPEVYHNKKTMDRGLWHNMEETGKKRIQRLKAIMTPW